MLLISPHYELAHQKQLHMIKLQIC